MQDGRLYFSRAFEWINFLSLHCELVFVLQNPAGLERFRLVRIEIEQMMPAAIDRL